MLTLKIGTFNLITGLEAEVTGTDERVPFVDLLQAASERAGEDQTAYGKPEMRSEVSKGEVETYRWGFRDRLRRAGRVHLRRRLRMTELSVTRRP